MKNIFYKLTGLLVFTYLLIIPLLSVDAANLGDAFSSGQNRLNNTASQAQFDVSAGLTPEQIISTAITALLSLLGIIFVGLLVYGGFVWMLAGGDEQKVTKATDIIKESLIGLVIVLGAYALSYFIIGALLPGGQIGNV
ncbi:MAG: hypothetical protein WC564_01020 [Patescibacteria group bacterium]